MIPTITYLIGCSKPFFSIIYLDSHICEARKGLAYGHPAII